MEQSIDFLKSLPKQKRDLPATMIGLILLALLILFTAISISAAITHHQKSEQLQEAQAHNLQVSSDFKRLVQAYPMFLLDKPLVDQVSEYETQLRQKQANFDALTHKTLRKPFSQYLQALAEITPPRLWLTNIILDQDTNNYSLIGNSMEPVSVSLFIQSLQKASIFKGLVFDLFYVRKVADKNYIQFEVANEKLMTPEKEEKKEKQPQQGGKTND